MPRRKKIATGSCHCPPGSKRITTKGRGRGWVCQSTTPRTVRAHKVAGKFVKGPKRWRKGYTAKTRVIKRPFVAAVCK